MLSGCDERLQFSSQIKADHLKADATVGPQDHCYRLLRHHVYVEVQKPTILARSLYIVSCSTGHPRREAA